MCSTDDRSTPVVPPSPQPPNAFAAEFLSRLAEQDEPPTAGDADVAGPWRIESVVWDGGHGFGLFRVGESLSRGFAPTAVFPSRWLALLMAGVLPGTGKDPLLLLSKEPDAHGAYPVALAGGGDDGGDGGDGGSRRPVGFLQLSSPPGAGVSGLRAGSGRVGDPRALRRHPRRAGGRAGVGQSLPWGAISAVAPPPLH